jgi:rare lipoprotein A
MKTLNMLFIVSICLLTLNGCMSTRHVLGQDSDSATSAIDYDKASGGGRYSILQDHAPTGDIKVDHLPDLVPKWEPKSRGGNKSTYEVWGKQYSVMNSAKGYTAEGTASWYGNKFHGHKTSNGEIYDMYTFSAAHKSLPIPTYLKVTNLDNQLTVIVRVNDRGPFHGDRLIDLSYAAAARLDYHKKGLARVRIEAITPAQGESYNPVDDVEENVARPVESAPVEVLATPLAQSVDSSSDQGFTHLQLGAFSAEESADKLKQRLFESFDTEIKVLVNKQDDGLFKVLIGPYYDASELVGWQEKLQKEGFGNSVKVVLLP